MKKIFSMMVVLFLVVVYLSAPVYADLPPLSKSKILTWDKNDDADYYYLGVIDRTANPGLDWPDGDTCDDIPCVMLMLIPDGGDTTEIAFSDIVINEEPLKAGTSYEFRLKAVNNCGNTSDWSDKVDYMIPVNTPAQPVLNFKQTEKVTSTVIIININGEIVDLTASPKGDE